MPLTTEDDDLRMRINETPAQTTYLTHITNAMNSVRFLVPLHKKMCIRDRPQRGGRIDRRSRGGLRASDIQQRERKGETTHLDSKLHWLQSAFLLFCAYSFG